MPEDPRQRTVVGNLLEGGEASMTQYRYKFYTDILLEVARFSLNSMVSFQSAVAVMFTGVFCTKMLQWVGTDIRIVNMIFLPCAMYFVWAFLISWVDMSIERDVL